MSKQAMCSNGMSYSDIIVQSGEKYQSAITLRILLLKDMKGKGVAFKDIEKYLLNSFRKDGFWSDPESLKLAENLDHSWFHHLQLFLGWLDRNYVSYDEKKKSVYATRKEAKKAKEEAKNTVKVRVAKVSEKKATELMKDPESVKLLLSALSSAGYIVGDELAVIAQLEEKGYAISKA